MLAFIINGERLGLVVVALIEEEGKVIWCDHLIEELARWSLN